LKISINIYKIYIDGVIYDINCDLVDIYLEKKKWVQKSFFPAKTRYGSKKFFPAMIRDKQHVIRDWENLLSCDMGELVIN
jgi:hypothetical protein